MTTVYMTTRILAYLPRGPRAADADEFGLVAAQARRLGLAVLRSAPYFFACRGAPGEHGGPVALIDVFEGRAASERPIRIASGPLDWSDAHSIAEREAQFYNLIEPAEDSLRIESDPLGLKPLYRAELPHGTVLASRILDILRIAPALVRPADMLALYQLMTYRATFGERTLHRRVHRAATGECLWWNRDGLSILRTRRLPIPPIEGTLFVGQGVTRIKNAVIESVERKTAELVGPIALALSGGFDSRLLAAVAREIGVPVRAFCFGRSRHPEVYCAKAVAKALGLPLTILPIPTENAIERLPLHLEAVEGTNDLATSHFTNLFAIAERPGQPILHGFIGDLMAGYHMRLLDWTSYSDLDTLADALVRRTDDSALFERLFGLPAATEELRTEIRRDLVEGPEPFQSFRLWDTETRQRLFVGGHIPTVGTVLHEIMPFYDRRLYEIWMSVPPIGLDHRFLFRRLLETHYPILAEIPHSEERYAIRPSLRRQLPIFARDLRHRIGQRILAAGPGRLLGLDSAQSIWTMPNLAGPRQRAHMLARIDTLRPVLSAVLGVEIGPAFAGMLRDRLQALRAVFLVSEYAAWLQDRLTPGAPPG